MPDEVSYLTVFRTRPAGDFLLQPYRMRRGSSKRYDARGVARVLVPKADFADRIASLVLENLDRSAEPVDEAEFDRTPDPPLQSYAAHVELDGERLTLGTMRRLHGGHVGTGQRWQIMRSEAPARLPELLLEALGERPEDIPSVLDRLKSKRRGGRQQADAGADEAQGGTRTAS